MEQEIKKFMEGGLKMDGIERYNEWYQSMLKDEFINSCQMELIEYNEQFRKYQAWSYQIVNKEHRKWIIDEYNSYCEQKLGEIIGYWKGQESRV